MKVEARLFASGVLFFVPVALVYGWFSGWEPVGTAGIALLGGLAGMIGGYFMLLSRRVGTRPEDDPDGEISQGAGDQGVYSPWSWWPLVAALGAALTFAGLAIGWWFAGLGVVVGALGVIGWLTEFSRGQHAH